VIIVNSLSAISCENNLHFDELTMRSALY